MNYWICFRCREAGHVHGGWFQMPEVWIHPPCPLNSRHGEMMGPYDTDTTRAPFVARAQENWSRVVGKVRKITDGSFRGSLPLTTGYYLELLDPMNRYGPEVKLLYNVWAGGSRDVLFLEWLKTCPNALDKRVIKVAPEKLKLHHMVRIQGNQIYLPPKFPSDWVDWIEKRNNGGELIFVMDQLTRIYVGIKISGRFQHSSFFGGKPVKMAGTFTVTADWKITGITNGSGHYMPGPKPLHDLLQRLKDGGMNLVTIRLKFWSGTQWSYDGDALTWFKKHWWTPHFVSGGMLKL